MILAAATKDQVVDETPAPADRPAGREVDAQPAPSLKPTDTPTEAEEVETAKADAEKEGKELELSEDGKPKRDAAGKFVKREKAAKPEAPAISFTPDERTKFEAYLAQKQGSKYAKDFTRKLVTWNEINETKAKMASERQQFDTQLAQARAKFTADVQEFQAKQAASTPSPDKYEAFAAKQTNLANEKELAAVKAENDGDFEGAAKLKQEAAFARRDAEQAKASAEHVRKNPPADAAAIQAKFKQDQGLWIGKARTDFPEFAKQDSPLFKGAVAYFQQITKDNPAAARLPGLIYHCVEREQLKTASARVPVLEKELGELRTKVKDLEALTNPVPTGGQTRTNTQARKNFEDLDIPQMEAQLRQEAAQLR